MESEKSRKNIYTHTLKIQALNNQLVSRLPNSSNIGNVGKFSLSFLALKTTLPTFLLTNDSCHCSVGRKFIKSSLRSAIVRILLQIRTWVSPLLQVRRDEVFHISFVSFCPLFLCRWTFIQFLQPFFNVYSIALHLISFLCCCSCIWSFRSKWKCNNQMGYCVLDAWWLCGEW